MTSKQHQLTQTTLSAAGAGDIKGMSRKQPCETGADRNSIGKGALGTEHGDREAMGEPSLRWGRVYV